jgi:hypothetical protein
MTFRPLKVFLCHAHADRDPVRGLYSRLTQDGVDAWLDKAKLLPGQDWELEIRKAVREADVVVVCLSKQFNQAGFRQKEVRLSLDTAMEKPEGEIFIIPARLEECDNLESLRKWHWVDLFEDDGYEMLMRAFRTRADKIGATLQVSKSTVQTKMPSSPRRKLTIKILIGIVVQVFLAIMVLSGLVFLLWNSFNQKKSPISTLPTEIATTISVTLIPHSTIAALPDREKPTEYTLRVGEYPYCIARRFNVYPDELISLSGLSGPDAYNGYVGLTLKIPPGGAFPGERALYEHPAIYTVSSVDEKLYWVACKFGDVFPEDIALVNGLSVDSSLSVGQVLQIP